MTHSYLTFAIPVQQTQRSELNAVLDRLDNPASNAVRDVFRASQIVHFMSSAIVPGDGDAPDTLIIETSVDGDAKSAIGTIFSGEGGALFDPLFAAFDVAKNDRIRFLERHRVETGQGYGDVPGLNFSGTPGMSVPRIRDEYRLARHLRGALEQRQGGDALAMVNDLRAEVAAGEFAPMLDPAPTPLLGGEQRSATDPSLLARLAGAAIIKYMWPALILAAVLTLVMTHHWDMGSLLWGFIKWSVILVLLSTLGFAAVLLRREAVEQGDLSLPDAEILEQVRTRENRGYVQNHLFGVSRIKPGLLRKISLRLAFWIIGQLAQRSFRPGHLGDIGTIHFARWFVIPGSDKLIFCSNYGGSWESYLEDFINKAADGLTGVWSNSFGFPPSQLLFFKGATEGEAFKRWARRQQIPTRFWYCAYPHLTTERIRLNAAIRKGLATAATQDEAQAFLRLFASAQRPDDAIERAEIQTLLFGGLGRHVLSACVLIQLPKDATAGKAWLADRLPNIGFGGTAVAGRIDQISFAATGLEKLALDAGTRAQFAFPFQQGMAHPDRQRTLADTGDDDPRHWRWGAGDGHADAAYLIYLAAEGPETPDQLAKRMDKITAQFATALTGAGGAVVSVVVTENLTTRTYPDLGNGDLPREPFGFVDGISQPVISALRPGVQVDPESQHKMAPGEFILGYPDNRGTKVILPTLPAAQDPLNLLPVDVPMQGNGGLPDFAMSGVNAARAFGRNGTYLVIRQLAQDKDAFDTGVTKAADAVKGHAGIPDWYTPEQTRLFIAAKMVGRWQDGTSLVRYPHEPGTGWDGKKQVRPDNDFTFGRDDPMGERCPYGSHIRRSNPRDSFPPHNRAQLDIVNRHRILRRGRFYTDPTNPDKRGLLFMCMNADIERQFEFIQETWSMARGFMGLDNEVDPITGRGAKMGRLTIPTESGPVFVKGLPDVVQVVGGEYFFMPSRSALRYLATS